MKVLLDTNVLLRRMDPTSPHHQQVIGAMAKLTAQGATFHLVSQNFYELWVVLTRPVAVNGLGKTTAEACALLSGLATAFTVLDDTPAVRSQWFHLVTTHGVGGKNAHDARLVAAMLAHGLTHLLTFNAADFQRITAISVLNPPGVAARP